MTEPQNKLGSGGLLDNYKTDRADPAVWMQKQPAMFGRAHKRWFILHRGARVLAYYPKAFIPPGRVPVKGVIALNEVTSVHVIANRIEIGVSKGRSTYKLTAESDKVAGDWAQLIKLEAHLAGFENPLNQEMQSKFAASQQGQGKTQAQQVQDLYSEYQDFRHAGAEAQTKTDETGNYQDIGAVGALGAAQAASEDTGNYQDVGAAAPARTAQPAAAPKPTKMNSQGKARPMKPKRPSDAGAQAGAAQPQQGGYMDINVGGAQPQQGGYMDINVGGGGQGAGQASAPAAEPVQAEGGYMDISVGGSVAEQPLAPAPNKAYKPRAGELSAVQAPPASQADSAYMDIAVGGVAAVTPQSAPPPVSFQAPGVVDSSYMAIGVGGTAAVADDEDGEGLDLANLADLAVVAPGDPAAEVPDSSDEYSSSDDDSGGDLAPQETEAEAGTPAAPLAAPAAGADDGYMAILVGGSSEVAKAPAVVAAADVAAPVEPAAAADSAPAAADPTPAAVDTAPAAVDTAISADGEGEGEGEASKKSDLKAMLQARREAKAKGEGGGAVKKAPPPVAAKKAPPPVARRPSASDN